MNAKYLLKFLGLFLVVMSSSPVFADSGTSQNTNPPDNGSAVLELKTKDPTIKRAPSRICLELQYSDGMLSLSSDYCEGEFAITFESFETSESYEIPTMAVGESVIYYLPSGEYNVTAVDSEGKAFFGCLMLQ